MMFRLYLIIFFTFTISVLSQDIDPKYLDSLPESIRKDVLDRIEQQTSSEEAVYRSSQSSSKIDKRRFETGSILDNEKEDNNKDVNKLELFGKDFFDTIQTSFMPISEPNMDASYILDFGDVLEIQFLGQKDLIDTFPVNRDGSINIPDIGGIKVSGLSLESASNLIKSKVKTTLLGTSAFITLVSVRDINILVSGNAYNPGVYTLSGNSNILSALSVSGGISEYGSYRDIQLIRNNEVIDTLDMYDVLINAKFNSKTRLRSGDVIFVNPVHNIVSIDGAVKRPAKYELFPEQKLNVVINYANGIKNDADLKNIFLDRILDGRIESLPIANTSMFKDIAAKDGDAIFIRKYPFRLVSIDGAVLNPGSYLMSEGDTINDLINKSGGYTKNAYPFGAVYENEVAKLINEISKDILYEEFIDNIISVQQLNPTGEFDLTSIISLTENLKSTEPNGRIVIDLQDTKSAESMILIEGDKVTIPEKPNHIFIYGEVSSEGGILFESGNDLDFYINKSGGFRESADKNAIYVLHPNGNSERFGFNRNIFTGNSSELELFPGSVIFVPRKIDSSASNRLAAQAYATILGNIGVSLASISVLKD